MKKFLSLIVLSLVMVLPFVVKADNIFEQKCGTEDENGIITCTINYNITEAKDSLTVTLTEYGGGNITNTEQANPDWEISSTPVENNGVWTILLVSSGISGEGELVSFSYQTSGTEDCKIGIKVGETVISTTPEETTPTTPETPTPDTTTGNKDTGATLPYIALGAIVLVATGAYLATRNKSKMYKI